MWNAMQAYPYTMSRSEASGSAYSKSGWRLAGSGIGGIGPPRNL